MILECDFYMYRKNRADIGDCLTVPYRFSSFCITKFGIKLDEARYGEYHPEWGSSMGYAPYTFMHRVNVYADRIVIDWTATQYNCFWGKPVPYIYEIGSERKNMGPLYKNYGNKTPNDQYIDDFNNPLFIEEQPVDYSL